MSNIDIDDEDWKKVRGFDKFFSCKGWKLPENYEKCVFEKTLLGFDFILVNLVIY